MIFFVCEVLKILETSRKKRSHIRKRYFFLNNHELLEFEYSKDIEKEIDFIAMHFYAFSESQKEELSQLHELTFHRIIKNSLLKLKDEDEFFNFINLFYNQNNNFENLYESFILRILRFISF